MVQMEQAIKSAKTTYLNPIQRLRSDESQQAIQALEKIISEKVNPALEAQQSELQSMREEANRTQDVVAARWGRMVQLVP